MYAVLQVAVIAAALAFSLQHIARKLMPRTLQRLARVLLPAKLAALVETKAATASGCGDSSGCGTCNACGNIAAAVRDLPPR